MEEITQINKKRDEISRKAGILKTKKIDKDGKDRAYKNAILAHDACDNEITRREQARPESNETMSKGLAVFFMAIFLVLDAIAWWRLFSNDVAAQEIGYNEAILGTAAFVAIFNIPIFIVGIYFAKWLDRKNIPDEERRDKSTVIASFFGSLIIMAITATVVMSFRWSYIQQIVEEHDGVLNANIILDYGLFLVPLVTTIFGIILGGAITPSYKVSKFQKVIDGMKIDLENLRDRKDLMQKEYEKVEREFARLDSEIKTNKAELRQMSSTEAANIGYGKDMFDNDGMPDDEGVKGYIRQKIAYASISYPIQYNGHLEMIKGELIDRIGDTKSSIGSLSKDPATRRAILEAPLSNELLVKIDGLAKEDEQFTNLLEEYKKQWTALN